jgi:DNA-binding transcriptional MocR family regulator
MWLGPVHSEARAAYHRARTTGLSPLRSLVIGTVASFKDCWTFRRNLAKQVGCSVRTVQRALTQARSEGLIGVARAKKTEVPPNWQHGPVTCGWSHRWVIGWGKAGEAVKEAVEAAKARWFVRHSMAPKPPAPASYMTPAAKSVAPRSEFSGLRMTAAQIDAELERLDALKKPPPS